MPQSPICCLNTLLRPACNSSGPSMLHGH
jgi:hypothetical protein